MRLRKLEIVDMFPFGKAKVDLSGFDLALIIGDNDETGKDSNGSGKSFLFDSIAYALFGRMMRKIPVDHLVRFGQKQGKIILSFELGGSLYRIRRYRGANNSLEFHRKDAGGDLVDLTSKTVTLTQEVIEDTIGMDFDTFRAATYFGQEDVSVFARGTSKERIAIVGRLLRLDILDGAAKMARDQMRVAEDRRSKIQNLRDRADEERENIDPVACRAEIKVCDKNQREWEAEAEALTAEIDHLAEIRGLSDDHEETLDAIGDLKQEWADERKKLKSRIEAQKRKARSVDELRKRIVCLESAIEPLEGLKGERDALETKVSNAKQRYSKADGERSALISERDSILATLDLEDAECPTCGQKIGKAAVAALRSAADEKDREAAALQKKMKTIRTRLTDGASKILELKEEIDRREIQRGALSRASVELSEAEGAEAQIEQIERDIEEGKARNDRRLKKLESRRKEIAAKLKEAGDVDIDEIPGTVEKLEERRRKASNEISELTSRRATMVERIDRADRLTKEIEDYDDRLSDLNLKHAIYSYWAEGFPRIKLLIVDSFIPEFERSVNDYLAKMAPQVQVRFDTLVPKKGKNAGFMEKFEIFISDMHSGREQPWDSWSGGEKKRVALALYLGLNSVASRAMTSKIGFLLLDEVLADLDQTGRELALELLEDERRGNRSIFLISHLPGIDSKFDDVITVVKRDGVSTVRTTR